MESDALDSANPTLSENEANLHESLAVSTLPAHIAELAATENWEFDAALRWQRARSTDELRLRDDGGECAVDDCGGPSSSASCYCDTWCDMFGDCCDNKAEVCGPEYCESDAECGGPQYCDRQDLTCDGIGRCLSRPELCHDFKEPVCGCDSATYRNGCYARQAGVSIAWIGSCEEGAPCIDNSQCGESDYCYRPDESCGDAGVCIPRPTACTLQWDPVYGCDAEIYANRCSAAAMGVSVLGKAPAFQ